MLWNGQEVSRILANPTYLPKQIEPLCVSLTVARLFRLKSKGSVDFGGSEFQQAATEPIDPVKMAPEDKYGWWELPEGQYLMLLNEKASIPKDALAIVVPSGRITQNGAWHPVQIVTPDSEILLPLVVSAPGIRIKENARVSQLVVISARP